ncbi:HAD family hydrolase [Salinicola avicenniae]|uniref:HAD family hydrolase n=1 Tax=Salinicola avicenniae TaxID=2916836 RepID=UPI002072CA22|nr:MULTISPECIES: HAD family hydrolase [unclassified Salinicola]
MPEMNCSTIPRLTHWVFDMDGTLTVGVHDFPAIRRELEIPESADILHHLETLPTAEREAKHAWLLAHERELALRSTAAVGAIELIRELCRRDCRLGILTRNAKALAHITLEAIGLDDCFAPHDVLGRDEAPPKPHPGGLDHFIDQWQVAPEAMVMVGDSHLDMACGRAAGTRTVLVNAPTMRDPTDVDWQLADCEALLRALPREG